MKAYAQRMRSLPESQDEQTVIECRAVTRGVRSGVRVTCKRCDPPMVTVVDANKVTDLVRRHLWGVHNMEVNDDG